MPIRSYSTDLRSRVIEHITSGHSQASASKVFKVSTSAISRWLIRYKSEGIIAAKARGGSKGKIDPLSLKKYVQTNPDKTLSEIGVYFGVSSCAIYKRIKHLGFSYKKKPSPMWKQVISKEMNISKKSKR
jgi:transposase